MKISSRPWLAAVCLLGCTDQRVYTPEGDTAVMAKIERSWNATVGKGSLSVTMREDRAQADRKAAAEDRPGHCAIAHVVRGGGRGTPDMQSVGGIGCGGCPFAVETYVTAVVQTPEGASSTWAGKIVFADA